VAGKIFINYRRGDDPGSAQALFARLEQVFRPEQLFMDVDNIEPGLDFVRVIKDQVSEYDVLISVIGRGWLNARDEHGERRLDDPSDFVRIEIESALQQDKRVIPVLVGQAQMPSAEQLPDMMKPLATRQAVRLTHERFRADAQALITALQRVLKSAEAEHEKQEAEAKRRDEEARRKADAAKRQAEQERQRQEAEAARRAEEEARLRAYEERRKHEAKAEHRRQAEVKAERGEQEGVEKPPFSAPQPRPPWQRPALIASVIGAAVICAIGVWIAVAPLSVPLSTWSPDQERALKPKDTFKQCTNCPVMMVVPDGSVLMGSPPSEPGYADERPQHTVSLTRAFAVAQFELTFDEWDACAADGGCNGYIPSDERWGRGRRPVVNASWDDAKAYVAWLAKKTGSPYRLLTEAEYEYAARAGTTTAYPWGGAIGTNNANCRGCGSQWGGKATAPVGSFAANGLGLYDMVGNLYEWTEDCYHDSYIGAPTDGSAWTSGDCRTRVARGGSWGDYPQDLRSARRRGSTTANRSNLFGFRVGKTLLSP
jgi:formylglycine-generating enzyme required for sulfatase activity